MTTEDFAWLDQQYNPLLALPDSPTLFGRWATASAQVRANFPCEIDLRYGAGPRQTLDWFSAQRDDAPVLVFIHGGYWRGSDKAAHGFIAPPFLGRGCDVVLLNYDLCPDVTIATIAQQVCEGIAHVHRTLRTRGRETARLVVTGHSAGGHLAAMALTCEWKTVGADLPAELVTRGLALSGLFELEPFRHAPFLKGTVRLDLESVRRLSPARFPPPAGRVLHAMVGALETRAFHRQTQDIADAWGPAVVPRHGQVPGADHFTIVETFAKHDSSLQQMAFDLLDL